MSNVGATEYPGLVRLVQDRLDRERLREQPIEWRPRTWLKWFPSDCDEGRQIQEFGARGILRSDVFELAQVIPEMLAEARVAGLRRLFLLSQIWGYGTVGYGAYRTARLMRQPEFNRRLNGAYELLLRDGAAAAYRSMSPENPNRVRGLGPAFATKFLYFAGYKQEPPNRLRPLILDSLVGAALHEAEPEAFGPRTGLFWDCETYARYLEAAWWVQSSKYTRYVLFPEDTERVLFTIARERRSGGMPA